MTDLHDLESLFFAALEKPPAERPAFLDGACGGNADLRRHVERLLAAHHAAGEGAGTASFADGAETADRPGKDEHVGAVLAGKYKLVEAIGEGGMGAVYLAQQTEPVKRAVAVKVIKAGMDSKAILARFEAERQALALMDHPNIARVLDAGTTDTGRPFFVMELVKGVPITKFCDERRLTPAQRLELFVPVCQAIQHAHQKGVIHRDIKPSNVLVALYDDRPVPKVIDFGVAKAAGQTLTDKTLLTGFGAVVGTPEYMSPEQASLNNLDVDTRSDVYSLGVLLYELLTGSTPVDRKSLGQAALLEVLRIVREVEPPKPSAKLSTLDTLPSVAANRGTEPAKLSRLMRGELDWLVLKALEKDRTRRYETANGFAADVQRYLAGEPVQAVPPTAGYRLRKFVRKNRGPVAAAGLVLAALLVGIAGTMFGLVRAVRAEADAREQARIAGDERDKADARFQLAADAVDTYLSQVTYDPDLNGSDFTALRRRLLQSAVPFYRKLADERQESPWQRAKQALAHHRLARIAAQVGDLAAAVREGEAARAIHAALPADARADPRVRYESAVCLVDLCGHLFQLGRLDEAFDYGVQGRDALAALAAEHPADVHSRSELAAAHRGLSLIDSRRGRHRAAVERSEAAIAIRRKLVADAPADPHPRGDLAGELANQGGDLTKLGDYSAAEARFVEAMTVYDGLGSQFPRSHDYRNGQLACRINLLAVFHERGDHPAARPVADAALPIARKLVADFPSVARDREGLATLLNNLGCGAADQRRWDAGERYHREALAIWGKACDDFPAVPEFRYGLVLSHKNLGLMYHRAGQIDASQRECEAAVAAGQRLVRDFPTVPQYQMTLADARNDLALALRLRGRGADARREQDAAIGLLERLVADFPGTPMYRVKLGQCWFNVGDHTFRGGDPAGAVGCYDRAIRALEAAAVRQMRNADAALFLRQSHQGRAKAYDQLHRPADADADWERTLELTAEADLPGVRMNRACSRVRSGRVDALREVEALIRTHTPGPNADEAGVFYDAACAYGLAARPVESVSAERREGYAKRAVELLAAAFAKGFRGADQMRTDPDLDPLRGRDDFQKLLAGPAAKSPPEREVLPPPRRE